MVENDVTQKILKMMCSVYGCFARKRHGGAYAQGDPDIAGVVFGRAFFCEMKVTGGELSKLQAEMLDRWAKAGAYTCVAVYDKPTKRLRIIQTSTGVYDEDGEKWRDLAGKVEKIEGGMTIDLDERSVENWVMGIPDCQGRQRI